MAMWQVPADVLASSGFAISPKAEVVGALGALRRPTSPAQLAFRAAHGAAFHHYLDQNPTVAEVLQFSARRRRGRRPGWLAEYLCIPPDVPHPTFEHEIEVLSRWSDEQLRDDLAITADAPLTKALRGSGLVDAAVDLVQWVWSHTVETDWPRRERLVSADIVARTAQLARHGWSAVLRDLGHEREWLAGGHLRIDHYDLPTEEMAPGSTLKFVPTHAEKSWAGSVKSGLVKHYALYYPLAGRLAPVDARSTPEADHLGALLGANRARVLRLLATPRSTSQIATLTGLTLGSVSSHLSICLQAGVVLRRRSGREVLYWRTPLGDALVASEK